MPDAVWEHWVRRGHVPADALVLSEAWTRGVWKRAGSLEVYHLFAPAAAPSPSADAPGPSVGIGADTPGASGPAARPEPAELPTAIWGRGLSITQALLLANLLVSAVLVWLWRDTYSDRLWSYSGLLHTRLFAGWITALFPPLFLHASAQHLLGNMIGLTAGGAAVEEFYGRRRTLALYLFSGICGALMSLLRPKEVLSVGASGAIMGLYGVILVFLLRYRTRFTERQRMKTTRIYLPLVVLALLPSLFQADLLSHVGGFLGGVLLALFVPPKKERMNWTRRAGQDAGPGADVPVPGGT
jgi:membrane associated rhomboid family serine protease